jgi:hypothetical protein
MSSSLPALITEPKPAPQVRPQERDRRAPELRAEHQQRRDERAAEELATAHRLGRGGRRFAQDRGTGRGLRLPLGLPGPREREPEEDREQIDDHDHDDDGEGAARDGEEGGHSSKKTPWAHGQTQL